MSAEVVPVTVPRGLAAISARVPALFILNAKAHRALRRILHRQYTEQEHATLLLQGRVPFCRMVRRQGTLRTTKLYDRRNDETSLDDYEAGGFEGGTIYTKHYIHDGRYIYNPEGYTQFFIDHEHIYGAGGYTKFFIDQGKYIYGPEGYTQFFIDQGKHIYGPSELLPWGSVNPVAHSG
jgi:hypothetical protein